MAHYECSRCGEVHGGPCRTSDLYEPGKEALIEAQIHGDPLPPPNPDLELVLDKVFQTERLPEERAVLEEPVPNGTVGPNDTPVKVVPPPPPPAELWAMAPAGANARQHGGDHYQTNEYQHWDWVYEMNLGYHVGNATKYIARWRKKNGIQDLEKALHYAEKCEELDIYPAQFHQSALQRFSAQLEPNDAAVIQALVSGNYGAAMLAIRWLIGNDAAK